MSYLSRTFNVMLEPTELITTITTLCQEKWTSWKLKAISLAEGTFEDVVLTDYESVMRGFLQLKQKIKTLTKDASTVGNSNYSLLTNI